MIKQKYEEGTGNVWCDENTKFTDRSITSLKARLKRYYNDIPEHSFMSNRYVLNKIILLNNGPYNKGKKYAKK
jgi:hypothetical protein